MKSNLHRLMTSMFFVLVCNLAAFAQGTTSIIAGSVHDQNGAVITGASVTVRNTAIGTEYKVRSSGSGAYSVPSLGSGNYTVTVEANGFKKAVVQDVKLDAGVPATVNVTMEVGAASESVVIQGGGEVLQTQSANIATTLQVKQIVNLPLQTRNVMDFLVLLPGVNTTGGPRGSTFNGLPQAAINITLDGLNTQDNFNKTGDGFFSYISPRVDAIEEVTVSTATPGAESGGQGAVQIKFVTRGGGNEFHGSLYEYHRNPWLNSNYWFNNRNQTAIHQESKLPCNNVAQAYDADKCHAPRDRVLLNQFGGRIGGPVVIPKLFNGRNKAFFFVNYEEFRQPTQISRTRTILNPQTQTGVFQYNVTAGGQTQVRQVNLLTLAAANGQTATIDPVVGKLLADIRASTTNVGGIQQQTDPNLQNFTFANSSSGIRYYPTVRFDLNLTSKHRLESVYNYHSYVTTIDTLNNRDPQFPGFPNHGGQYSNRFSESLTLRSTLSPTIVNEARIGFNGGTVLFFPDVNVGNFTGTVANQAGFNLGIGAAGITSATNTTAPSRRNAPVWDIADTVTWTRGSHSLSFGGQFTQINFWVYDQTLVPSITFGVNTNDPAAAMFTAANFQGAAAADLTRAQNIYATLTGRVTAINANARLNEETGKYEYLGPGIQRGRQRETGVFAQDSWRMRQNLTLTYGLRWELQMPFTALNSAYSTTTIADLFGVSGNGNLFKPGTQTGRTTQFIQFKQGDSAYDADYKNFAPSIGFAWSLNPKQGWLKRLAGDGGQTVLRGGYSIAYNRQGEASFSGVLATNPGSTLTTNRDLTQGNLVTNVGNDRLPVLLRETSRLGAPAFPGTPTYPFAGVITNSASIFDPGLRVPYTQSWTFGIQREISKDMAIEARYIHTLNLQQWVGYNLNAVENNILENGFLNEFKLAQANLQANVAAGRANQGFRYMGPGTGTSPLPITLAHFSAATAAQATDPARYNSALFTNNTFLTPLAMHNPNPVGFAGSLYGDAGRRTNALNAGLAANFFVTNPGLTNVTFTGNGGFSRYDGLQVELRRRLSKGLLVQANYTFAKSFGGSRPSFRVPRIATISAGVGTLAHAFKANWGYELPFGRGKMLLGNAGGLLDRVVGGWEFQGTTRIQSGNLLNFGTVRLVGMTRAELQKAYKLRFDDANKIIYALPQDIIDNTIRAFNVSATTRSGYPEPGGVPSAPTGRYIAPAGGTGCINVVSDECAPFETIITGPMFTRFDLSILKRVRIKEKVNFELRGEFLNAFNHINFSGVTCASNAATCGQVTASYRDVNNTQDPGGRLVQIVARLNF